PDTSGTEAEGRDVQNAAATFGNQLILYDILGARDIETAFATFGQRGADGLLVGSGPTLASHRRPTVAPPGRNRVTAVYSVREFVWVGGLRSYGTSLSDAYRLTGVYAGRILKGEKPAELPVMQSTKFEFVLNLKTAKALGLEVPDKLLALADEVIE